MIRSAGVKSLVGVGAIVCGATACHSDPARAPEPTPPANVTVDAMLGGLAVHVESAPLRIVIARADGALVFDGLPGANVVAPDPNNDAQLDPAPRTALAVRRIVTAQESMFGAFKLTETPVQWTSATRADQLRKELNSVVFEAVDDAGAHVASVAIAGPAEGEVSIKVTPHFDAAAAPGERAWASIAAHCDDTERFQGFGQQQRDVEHHGAIVPVFVSEPGIGKTDDDAPLAIYFVAGTRHASGFPAPIYVASRGYVGAIDGAGRALFGMCSARDAGADAIRISEDVTGVADGALMFRIFDGPTPKLALTRSTARFGRPRVPPRLAFAPWNDAIFGTANVEAQAKKLRDADIPSSAIWTEDFRGGDFVGDNYRLKENWLADPTLYPDLDAMIAGLHTQGFAWFAYYNTFIQQGNDVWPEAQGKFLVKGSDGKDAIFTNAKQAPSGLVDLTNAAAAAWTTQKLHDMLARGANGWMGDYGEWQPLDAVLADGSDAWTSHNLYPQRWQQAQRAALDATDLDAKSAPLDERLSFVRSGWLGTAPLADVVWGGDQRTDFEIDDGLPTVLPMGIGMGVAGISTFGSDIGGYQSATNPPTTKETFFRWAELGAWSPVMRTHHGTAPKLTWHWDSDAETIAFYRAAAIQHQQLLPTFEALATEAHETGAPIWRSLALEFPSDVAGWSVADEVMIGPSLLVAPVQTQGSTSRKVYFPSGSSWYPWIAPASAATAIAGGANGASVDVTAALSEIPVFLRAGSVIVELPERVRSVIHAATGVVRVEDVGDARVVVAASGVMGAGNATTFKERRGYTYVWSSKGAESLSTSATATWNGVALTPCDAASAAPCGRATSGRFVAFVTGDGALAIGASSMTVTRAGKSDAPLTIDVRGGP